MLCIVVQTQEKCGVGMSKVRLIFKNVTEIVGSDDVGLLILVDEQQRRQLTIPCDRNMLYQFSLRVKKVPVTNMMLPEVLWKVISTQTEMRFEILINDLIDGQYRAVLYNAETLEPISTRVSDAMLLAYVSDIPVYIDEKLMKKQSVRYVQDARGMSIPVNTLTDEMLRRALDKAVEDEHYELASQLRDEMKRRNLLDA